MEIRFFIFHKKRFGEMEHRFDGSSGLERIWRSNELFDNPL